MPVAILTATDSIRKLGSNTIFERPNASDDCKNVIVWLAKVDEVVPQKSKATCLYGTTRECRGLTKGEKSLA